MAWKRAMENVLKAAGTPMIRPLLSANSVARLTLLPGAPSSSSTLGMESPGLTMVAMVCVWEGKGKRLGELEEKRRIVYLSFVV